MCLHVRVQLTAYRCHVQYMYMYMYSVHVHVMNHESLANCEFASLLLPVFYVHIMQLHIIHVNFIHIHYVYSRIYS